MRVTSALSFSHRRKPLLLLSAYGTCLDIGKTP
jgi:hypothetical protein